MTDLIIKALIVAVIIVGVYYFASPYENCMRDGVYGSYLCEENTKW